MSWLSIRTHQESVERLAWPSHRPSTRSSFNPPLRSRNPVSRLAPRLPCRPSAPPTICIPNSTGKQAENLRPIKALSSIDGQSVFASTFLSSRIACSASSRRNDPSNLSAKLSSRIGHRASSASFGMSVRLARKPPNVHHFRVLSELCTKRSPVELDPREASP